MNAPRPFMTTWRKRLLNSRVLNDSFAVFIGDWFGLFIALVTSALLARILGPNDFGLIGLAMTGVNFIIQFIDAQTDEALIRFMGNALARDERDEALTFFCAGVLVDAVVALVALVVVVIVVPPLMAAYPQGERLVPLVWIFLLTTPFTILQSNFESVFKTFKQFRLSVKIMVSANILSLIILVAAATSGVVALIWGYVAVTLIRFGFFSGFALWLLRKNLRGARAIDIRGTLRRLMPFVLHTSFVGSLKSLTTNIDTLLLGAMVGASAVSYFGLARSAISLIALPVNPVNNVVYPLLNEAWARQDTKRVQYLIGRLVLYSLVVAGFGAIVFLIFADVLVVLVYGAAFLPVAPLIRILLIGGLLESVMGWVRRATLMAGEPQLATFSNVAAIGIRLAVTIPLVYLFDVGGAAIAINVGVVISVLINLFYVLPRLNIWQRKVQV